MPGTPQKRKTSKARTAQSPPPAGNIGLNDTAVLFNFSKGYIFEDPVLKKEKEAKKKNKGTTVTSKHRGGGKRKTHRRRVTRKH
jgi:hypothetical protein